MLVRILQTLYWWIYKLCYLFLKDQYTQAFGGIWGHAISLIDHSLYYILAKNAKNISQLFEPCDSMQKILITINCYTLCFVWELYHSCFFLLLKSDFRFERYIVTNIRLVIVWGLPLSFDNYSWHWTVTGLSRRFLFQALLSLVHKLLHCKQRYQGNWCMWTASSAPSLVFWPFHLNPGCKQWIWVLELYVAVYSFSAYLLQKYAFVLFHVSGWEHVMKKCYRALSLC